MALLWSTGDKSQRREPEVPAELPKRRPRRLRNEVVPVGCKRVAKLWRDRHVDEELRGGDNSSHFAVRHESPLASCLRYFRRQRRQSVFLLISWRLPIVFIEFFYMRTYYRPSGWGPGKERRNLRLLLPLFLHSEQGCTGCVEVRVDDSGKYHSLISLQTQVFNGIVFRRHWASSFTWLRSRRKIVNDCWILASLTPMFLQVCFIIPYNLEYA